MAEKAKKHAKGEISEEDISTLLQRYTPMTVLKLLQEVANFPDTKIDWNALVTKTSTGISNAKEYQTLWRHLAYRHPLIEKLDNGAEPLDDDSDLEFNLEAGPAVSSEASTEAAAYVKVHITSGLLMDSSLPNSSTVEAPLTINIPNGQSFKAHLENSQARFLQGKNITVPVFVHKQPLPAAAPAEGLDANGSASGSMPPRKKRKLWSAAEDRELIAAVQKFGEGNWANILKGEFKGDRSATQLSQRWSIIRKKRGNLNVGVANSTVPQLSQSQLETRKAIYAALDLPVGNLRSASSVATAGTSSNNDSSNSANPLAPEVGSGATQTKYQTQQSTAIASRIGLLSSAQKSRLPSKKMPTKPAMSPNSMVKATAVAAGARIATPEDAASLLKAAQAKNAVHIMPGGGSLIKSSVSGCASPSPSNHLGAHHNVHFVCTGMAATPLSTYSAVTPSALRHGSAKPVTPTVQSINATSSNMDIELPSKQEVKISEDRKVLNSGNGPFKQIQEGQPCLSGNPTVGQVEEDPLHKKQVQEDQTAVPVPQAVAKKQLEHVQEDQTCASDSVPSQPVEDDQAASTVPEAIIRNQPAKDENLSCSLNTEASEKDQATAVGNQVTKSQNVNGNKMMDLRVEEAGDVQSEVKEREKGSTNEKQRDPSSVVMGGSCDKIEALNEPVAMIES